jgi:hypothetical protein
LGNERGAILRYRSVKPDVISNLQDALSGTEPRRLARGTALMDDFVAEAQHYHQNLLLSFFFFFPSSSS